jgi:DNA-binding winged helix-turn-helix (wHTH) protein
MHYVFGDYTLDTQCYELRSAAGVVPLDRQGFAMLVYLVQHRDRVVLRQELFDRLWPECFVSDASLEHCVAVGAAPWGIMGGANGLFRPCTGGAIALSPP